ncbi:aldo/keto reductase [Pseudomonas sp. LJDD11]|uniref:aldo/keto reductase n=1 Tax=unclassified Pseudomonas TaxID=196821 RepID=UPI002096D202|nr:MULTISPECIES: aldo/keto reductase [unclassified Pseudomonas]MCO8164480.1 aldo/keto reductase [Pseudomonas sp. 21LCFQ010]MCQ9423967.1 aldo/keto reductase [Pseudomonas sp. LJDD11]
MQRRTLGATGFDISPLVFGGNVLGWTIDEKTSFAVLDAFIDHGFDAIDTADVYSAWAEGNQGGESETIIGNWLQARPGLRDKIRLFTKVGSQMGSEECKGLSQRWIDQAVEASLARLQTDYIDLYFSHWPDPEVAYQETLAAYGKLLGEGKIRSIGASNLNYEQLVEALTVAQQPGLPSYQVLQPEFNLYDREGFAGDLQQLCIHADIGVVTYYSLASGFLSGKYRSEADLHKSQRGGSIGKYLNRRGLAILDALDDVAMTHSASPSEVALAWLLRQPGVTAPIVSATSVAQVESLARAATLQLSDEEVLRLSRL